MFSLQTDEDEVNPFPLHHLHVQLICVSHSHSLATFCSKRRKYCGVWWGDFIIFNQDHNLFQTVTNGTDFLNITNHKSVHLLLLSRVKPILGCMKFPFKFMNLMQNALDKGMKFKKKDFSKMSQNVFWVTNGLGASKRWILVWFELSLLWWSQVVLKFNIFYSFLLYFLLTDSNVIVEEMMHRFWS